MHHTSTRKFFFFFFVKKTGGFFFSLFFHFKFGHHQFAHLLPLFGTFNTGRMKVDTPVKPCPVVFICRLPEGGKGAAWNAKLQFGSIGVGKIVAKHFGKRFRCC